MDETTTRQILWVKAIEEGDPQAEVFPLDERAKATVEVAPGSDPNPADVRSLLAGRAGVSLGYLTDRHGQAAEVPDAGRPLGWITLGLCLLALMLGFLSDRFFNRDTINVISAPLLAILGWNALVYVWQILSPFLGRRFAGQGLQSWLQGAARPGSERATLEDPNPPWGRLRGNFLRNWVALVARRDLLRLSSGLHLAAACFALGLVGGLYLSGLVRHFLAVWESTFLDHAAFDGLARILFGPASKLTGIPVEVTEQMNAVTGGGVRADGWIHLCAVTLVLFVVLPRLVLALVAHLRSGHAWASTTGALQPDLDGYARDLLRQISKSGLEIAVIPCGIVLPTTAHEVLRQSLQSAVGKPGTLRFLEGPAYGEEDGFADEFGEPVPDIAFLVFPLTATPEEEAHGLLAEVVAKAIGRGAKRGTIGLLYADRFSEKFGEQPEYQERLTRRMEIWSQMLSARGVSPLLWTTTTAAGETGEAILEALRGANH